MTFSCKAKKENSQWHTKWQIETEKEAQNSFQMMMIQSALDFKNAIKMNHAHNCHAMVEDINVAEDIFGKDVLH